MRAAREGTIKSWIFFIQVKEYLENILYFF
jgi:hypothetical protein